MDTRISGIPFRPAPSIEKPRDNSTYLWVAALGLLLGTVALAWFFGSRGPRQPVAAAPEPKAAPAPPKAPPLRLADYDVDKRLNPVAPRAGEMYVLQVRFRNRTREAIVFHAEVRDVPIADRLLGDSYVARLVRPGEDQITSFPIYCGAAGGRVNFEAWASWPEGP